jgi:hypothetical protein
VATRACTDVDDDVRGENALVQELDRDDGSLASDAIVSLRAVAPRIVVDGVRIGDLLRLCDHRTPPLDPLDAARSDARVAQFADDRVDERLLRAFVAHLQGRDRFVEPEPLDHGKELIAAHHEHRERAARERCAHRVVMPALRHLELAHLVDEHHVAPDRGLSDPCARRREGVVVEHEGAELAKRLGPRTLRRNVLPREEHDFARCADPMRATGHALSVLSHRFLERAADRDPARGETFGDASGGFGRPRTLRTDHQGPLLLRHFRALDGSTVRAFRASAPWSSDVELTPEPCLPFPISSATSVARPSSRSPASAQDFRCRCS